MKAESKGAWISEHAVKSETVITSKSVYPYKDRLPEGELTFSKVEPAKMKRKK